MTTRLAILTVGIVVFTSGQNLVKRSDDTDPLEAVVSRLAQDVEGLRAEVQSLKNHDAQRAAVHGVRLVYPDNCVDDSSPIKFVVASQVGGGYDSATGIYTAPYSGWYIFHARLNLKPAATFRLEMLQNDRWVGQYLCVDTQQVCAYSVTLHVTAGDRLWLAGYQFSSACYHAAYDNVFSAILVQPD